MCRIVRNFPYSLSKVLTSIFKIGSTLLFEEITSTKRVVLLSRISDLVVNALSGGMIHFAPYGSLEKPIKRLCVGSS